MNDTQDVFSTPQPHACPSPASSSASDSDAFNTADARLYFGPLRSPEKKFIPMLTRGSILHPAVSGSPRLSAPMPQLSPRGTPQPPTYREKDADLLPHRTNTPDIIECDLQDEPPSALAMRISRAHDNPSPPPQSSPIAVVPDIVFPLPYPFLTSPDNSRFTLDSGSDIRNNLSSNSSPSLTRNISPMPLTANKAPGHMDLISFDSASTPTAPYRQISPALGSPKPPPLSNNLSVDDILSRSPELWAALKSDDGYKMLSEVTVAPSVVEPSGTDEWKEREKNVGGAQGDKGEELIKLSHSPPFEGLLKDFAILNQPGGDQEEKGQEHSPPGTVRGVSGACEGQAARAHVWMISQPQNSHEPPSPLTDQPTVVLPLVGQPLSLPSSSESMSSNTVTGPSRVPTFPRQPLPQTPMRPTLPIRFTSPLRPTSRGLGRVDLADPSRTPARRIPMAEAISQGYVSPMKESRILASSSRIRVDTVKHPTLNISSTHSPVRGIGISGLVRPAAHGIGTPIRGFSKLRVGSAEPPALEARSFEVRKRAGSTPPPLSRTTKDTLLRTPIFESLPIVSPKPGKLPFPIVALKKEPIPPIPEEPGTDTHLQSASPANSKQEGAPSSAKVTLKQATSRIPRTVKPYGRPTPKPKPKPNVDANIKNAKTTKVIRMVDPSDTALQTQIDDFKSQDPIPATSNGMPSLKRKRGMPEASPVRPRPVVLLRQVPRVIEASASSTSNTLTQPSTVSQEKPLQKIRLVVDKPPLARVPSPQLPASSETNKVDEEVEEVEAALTDVVPSSPIMLQTDVGVSHSSSGRKGVRRTTRARKPITSAQHGAENYATRPVASRRKLTGQASQRQEEPFLGMSATALRALTTSNTAKNQHYVAAQLETEVIRKDGHRPESPAVKIRTVSQRQQDEKSVQRRERAAKRAKRDQIETGGCSDGDLDNESDLDDQNSSPLGKQHKRGPGDEEEYQTPLRKLKRLKLGEDDDEIESILDERRVKWDRGLSTTIYLDEVKLGMRQPPRERVVKKGCLAPTAKAILLDNLGNLPYAESPLTDLVKESVVVKRFVYDDDREPSPALVVKNTRSRNKKGKS